jgi:hypothetical protein
LPKAKKKLEVQKNGGAKKVQKNAFFGDGAELFHRGLIIQIIRFWGNGAACPFTDA